MADDPYNTRELSPAEQVSMGLLPAGPLAPAIRSTNPDQNLQNIRDMVNPPPMPVMVDKPTRSGEVPSLTEDPEKIPYTPLRESAGNALPFATMLMGNPSGFLGRMALNAGVGAASEGLKSLDPVKAAEVGAGSGILGGALEKVGQGARYLGSPLAKKAFDAAQEKRVGDWLTKNVPWWKGLSISEMATSTKGTDALQKGYADAFMAARDKIPEDATVSIPITLANELGIKGASSAVFPMTAAARNAFSMGAKTQSRDPAAILAAMENVNVPGRELIDKLPGAEGELRGQILRGLRSIGADTIPEATNAYKTGMGWQELANRGGIGKEGIFNAQTAQEALRKPVVTKKGAQSLAQKALGRRGMGELEEIIQGPLKEPITSKSPNSFGWHLGLGGTGLLRGMGLHGVPGLAGGLAALIPRPTFYNNVPRILPEVAPATQQGLRVVLPGFLGNMVSTE